MPDLSWKDVNKVIHNIKGLLAMASNMQKECLKDLEEINELILKMKEQERR